MTYTFTDGIKDIINGEFVDSGVSNQRYDICKTCDLFNRILLICNSCGCFMPAKIKLVNADCPEGKW